MKTVFRIALGIIPLLIGAALGSIVEASPADAPASSYVSGCTGEYFNNTGLSGSPVLVRSDPSINFYWRENTSPGPGVNVSNYSVRWTCSVYVTTAGSYTFTMRADDGMNLLVDNTLLIWAWYDQGPSTYSNPIYLSTGWHTIRVEYYNNTLGGTAQVYFNLIGTTGYSNSTSGLVSNCTGEYFNNTGLSGSPVLVRSDPSINFYWREYTSPGAGVNVNNYSVRWTCSVNVATAGTYTFTIVADDGMNLLVDNNLLIWAWYDQGPSSYSNPIYLNAGWHTIRVEYYNNTLGGTAKVSFNLTGSTTSYDSTSGDVATCTGEYFNNTDLSGSPALVRSDSTINFYWAPGVSPGTGINTSYYSVRWTCTINTAVSRGYTVSVVTDDGMNVWVDGNYLISAWQDQSPSTYSNSIYLSAGAHLARIEYYNRTMGGTAQVSVY